MEYTEPLGASEENDAIIVKADEVDEAGADISTISPADGSESEFNARIESRRAQDAQAGGSPKILANAVPNPPRTTSRPILRREGSAPAPPQQPPPNPPQSQDEPSNSTDSLSLLQLKRLVTDLPKPEPIAYAFEYSETRSFPEELQEWFSYTEEERYMLLQAKETFNEKWEQAQAERPDPSDKALGWTDVGPEDRESFIVRTIKALDNPELSSRVKSLECISYVALGAWGDTAGMDVEDDEVDLSAVANKWVDAQNTKTKLQLKWIINGTRMLCKTGAVQKLFDVLRRLWESEQYRNVEGPADGSSSQDDKVSSSRFLKQIEVNQTLTALYVLIEAGRLECHRYSDSCLREIVISLKPSILLLLTQIMAKLRWEEGSYIPLPRILLLFWKTVLLIFGNLNDIERSKIALKAKTDLGDEGSNKNIITASPLDYHLFRQEITSKYPAYNPPPPLVPIEPENNSILPPLPNHPSRQASQDNLQIAVGASINGTGGSIFNQPVHIATPAPSPPPSPAGPGGKGGKKQNYQTNQNFPFLYPPLDDTSNTLGGKGTAELQDHLVRKRWEGSDVPASILEAGELFASRMRMTRSIWQLWDVREKYIKYERGWNEQDNDDDRCSHEDSESENDEDEDGFEDEKPAKVAKAEQTHHEKETDDDDVQQRLDAINDFYCDSLPHLQSVVMVLWRALFSNVSALVAQNGQNGMPNGISFGEDGDAPGKKRTNPNSSANINAMANGQLTDNDDGMDPIVEELNAVRSREIISKAVSGVLLILLKWYKLSHILKYEYLTQLLLDANYLPLILKYFAHQDVDRAVDQKNDREDLDFFYFCHVHSKTPPKSPTQPALSSSTSSEDEAAPPPIRTHRRSPTSQSPPRSPPPAAPRPEVDELGYPTTALPQTPITNYAPRFFLTNINLLRLLQKITKRKAHRALLLVQYKSSTILRKALKMPQPELRLYTLKLFKSQVPYCGRKWRQTNMRVITAIYLHCRPELRDEWLCGGDVDGVVEEAVPLEQAGRSLVHWWHLREFRSVMEGKKNGEGTAMIGNGEGEDEYNFFTRELEKMGWGFGGGGSVEEEELGVGVDGGGGGGGGGGGVGIGSGTGGGTEFEGGPLAMEGWA